MGTPEPKDFEASLHDFAGTTIAKLVRQCVSKHMKILDVGAGWMKYRLVLPEYGFDAIEAWEPNVREHRYEEHYGRVFIGEAVDYRYPYRYGAVILGDVLEHMSVPDAQKVIAAACDNADHVFVAVPFMMPQHEEDGNRFEAHVQDDIDEQVMAERYPQLKFFDLQLKEEDDGEHLVAIGHTKAIYVKP